MFDDESLFRQKDPTSVPRGQEQSAVDAVPSEQSGTTQRIGVPVWRSFVVSKQFQEQNQEGIRAEQNQLRMAEASNRRSSRTERPPMFKGAKGKLIRVQGGRGEELNPEEWADDPEVGPIARKSLWEKEIGTARQEAEMTALELSNPAFHARGKTDKEIQDIQAQAFAYPTADPKHQEFQAQIDDDAAYRKEKDELAQRAWNAKARAAQIEAMEPDAWWQSRTAPTPQDKRAEAVATTQAERAKVQAADNSAIERRSQINAKFAQGVTGAEAVTLKAELAELDQSQAIIAQERVKAEEPVKAVQAEAQAKIDERGVFGETISAFKRGYAGAMQSANILQGATDATNAQDIADYEKIKTANPSSKDFQDFQNANGFMASAKAFLSNPVRIITEVMAESAAQMVPSIALGVAGGSAGGAVVSAPTAGVAAPATVPLGALVGGAVGAGTGSFLAEYGSAMMQSMQDAGMDATKPESIQQFFSDEEKLATAREFAIKRGVPIALFDAASMGLAGKFAKPLQVAVRSGEKVGAGKILAATSKEIATQAATGAAGETAGQLASTGEITDGKSIFLEGIAEVGSAPVEVASNLREFGMPKKPDGTPIPPVDIKPDVDTVLAAIDPELPGAEPAEIERAAMIVPQSEGIAGIADGVLIERELSQVEAEDEQILADATASVEAVRATGDTKATKAAEEQTAGIRPRAPTVRAVLKISAGQQLDDLTTAELAGIGMEATKTGFKQIKDAPVLAYPGADGSVILTDAALKAVGDVSPRARGRVRMSEAEAIQKAKQRAQQISTDTPDGAGGELQTGLPSGGGSVPIETKGAVEFDVPTRSGRLIRVQAATAAEAEQEAAAVSEMGDNVLIGQAMPVQPTPTTNESNAATIDRNPQPSPTKTGKAGGTTQSGDSSQSGRGGANQESPENSEREVPAGILDGDNSGISGLRRAGVAGNSPEIPEGSPKVAKKRNSATTALVSAKSKLTKARKNPKLAKALNVTNGPAVRAEAKPDGAIHINPERVIGEALDRGMNDDQAAEYFTRVLDEEIRHLAQYDAAKLLYRATKATGDFLPWMEAHYAAIWQTEFVATGKADTIRDIYAKTETGTAAIWSAMTDGDKALEAIRMMSQGDAVTEQAKLWLNIGETLRKALTAALAALKQFSDIASPALQAEIANLENALKQLRTESKPRGGSPKADSAKPAQSRAGDGNGRTSPQDSAGPAPGDGGTQPARSDSAGSPLAVGARVSFVRDGVVTEGVIGNLGPSGRPVTSLVGGDGVERARVKFEDGTSKAVPVADLTFIDPPAVKGDPINKDWHAFAPESGTLGIPRAMMPQIHSGDRSALVQFLKARGVSYGEETVPASSLKPTQTEYSPAKVAKAKAFTGGNRSILISSDNHVLDGHHQWMAALENGEDIAVIRLDAPIRKLLPMAMQMPSVTVDGGEILEAPKADIPTDTNSQEATASQATAGETEDTSEDANSTETPVPVTSEAAVEPKAVSRDEAIDQWAENTRANLEAFDAETKRLRAEQSEKPAISALSEDEQALKDFFGTLGEGLEAAPLVSSDFYRSKGIPRDKRAAFLDVADKLYDAGVRAPTDLATKLEKIGAGKLRAYSAALWSGMQSSYPDLPNFEDWAGVYGRLDNPAAKADGAVDDNAPQFNSGGQGPQAGDAVERGAAESVASEPGGETTRPGTAEQLPDNGGSAGGSEDSGTVRGDAPRPSASTQGGERLGGDGSKRGGNRSPQGTDSVGTGDGSGVVGGKQSAGITGYRLTDPERIIGAGGPKARFARNKHALETYDKVLSENRKPTAEEQDALASYIGWGSFGQELFQGSWERPNPQPAFAKESEWLRDHLGQAGWESIRDSIINAHYTDPPHIQALWRIVEHLGFKGGRVLEPSMGIGSFFGLMPDILRSKSSLTGIELDRVVGGMAQMLYPDANIRIMGYEKSATADGFYDLVIGNWPFASEGPSDPRYNSLGLSLHDYFFVKALDQTRPGGLVIGITSSGTMDKKGQTARRQMARRAELVAAFRFPTGAFEKYAGTKVVTDVVILKKRDKPASAVEEDGWMNTESRGKGSETFSANEYWSKHPENVLGEMKFGNGTTQGRAGMIVERQDDYQEKLARIEQSLPKDILAASKEPEKVTFQNREDTADQNSVTWNEADGAMPAGFYIVRGEQLQPLEDLFTWTLKEEKKTGKRRNELKQLLGIREDIKELLRGQREGDPQTETIRARAKTKYDTFVKAHGAIRSSFMAKALVKAGDPMALTLENLERSENGKFVPRDILLKDIMRRPVADAKGDIGDAYAIQRNQSTTLDVEAIAKLAGKPVAEVIDRLVKIDQIYKTPTGEWEAAEEYLGGNVRRKLREARDAKEQGIEMDRNIEALEKVQPKDVAYFEIEVQMGASWIPREDYLNFASRLLGGDVETSGKDFELTRAISGWNFKINNPSLKNSTGATATWGTDSISFAKIFQAAMNGTTVKIYDTDRDGVKHLNTEETDLANKKIDDIREELANWLWSEPSRAGRIANDYNEVMNSEVVPKRNGSHLRFEGLVLTMGTTEFDFRQHQKDAVWRGIMDGQMLAAHEVGTGKTFTMAGLAVEGRRLGKFRKSLVFAHNANAESVYKDFQAAYPGGKFLFIDSLSPSNRENAMRQIANDEWDAVIVTHSLIDRFALREETLMEIAQKQIKQLESEIADALQELGVNGDLNIDSEEDVSKALKFVKDSHTAKELVKTRNRIIKRIKDKAAKAMNDNAVFFEDLGVDAIMVDEAHMFKKIALATRKEVKGLNKTESDRGWMLGALTDTVKARNNGKGVFLFTGTPLTNNLNEAYNMMRFVMDDAMTDAGLNGFDDWFNSFAQAVSDVELTTGGTYEPVTRLLSFINVPELARLAGRYFDVVQAKSMPEFIPRASTDGKTPGGLGRPFKVMRPVTAEMSPAQKAHKSRIQTLYKAFQALPGKEKRRAMLNGTNTPIQLESEGIKAALDMRLIDPTLPDYPDSKANLMVRNAISHYEEDPKATQMIFMERGWNDFTDAQVSAKDADGKTIKNDDGKKITSKQRRPQFNLVRDMVEKLVAQGVRPDEIAVFSNMTLDPVKDRPGDVLRRVNRVTGSVSKEDLAALMREGKIRFAFGSTQTMGTGVNAQDNMRAMHHLDAPWTPGEFEQRNGRGHRQGNQWNTVYEYRYFTEGSHDGRRWQVLLNKVKFISRFTEMLIDAGGSSLRVLTGDGADLNEGGSDVADFEQSFSTAAGDPRILVRAKLKGDVEKLERRRDTHFQSIARAKGDIGSLKQQKKYLAGRIKNVTEALERWNKAKEGPFSISISGKTYTDRKDAEAFLAAFPSLTQKDNNKVVVEYNGAKVFHRWQTWEGGKSTFQMKLPTSDSVIVLNPSLSLGSIEATVRGQSRVLNNLTEEHDGIDGSVASLEEMIQKPFTREAELETKQAALQQIQVELDRAPQPAPSWLRNGAPVGSLVYLVDGKAYDVAAHRWDDNGWWVLVENESGMQPVDYRKVMDETGHPMFEEVEFTAPERNDGSESEVSDDTAAFGQFIDQQEGRGLRAAELPQKLRADSLEWKAMSKAERMAYLQRQKGGLRAADLPSPAGDPVVNALAELAKHDEVFRFPVSQKSSLRAVMADVFPRAQFRGDDTRPDESRESGADKRTAFSFTADDGKERLFYVYETDDSSPDVWIDVSRLTEGDGGSGIYAAVGNYAHNTRGSFIGDPAGLSEAATVRRTSAMLSMALRFGTTSFMEPSKSQLAGIPEKGIAPLDWKGNDAAKARALIQSFLGSLYGKFPALKEYSYDFGRNQFVDRRGRPLDAERLEHGKRDPNARAARAGEASLRRGIFLQSLVSGTGGKGPDLLGQLLNRGSSVTDSGLGGLFAAPLPDPAPQDLDTFKKRGRAAFETARPLIENAEEQMKAFGSGSMGVDPKFANFGGRNQTARDAVDIVRALDTHNREIRADRDTYAKGLELFRKDREGVHRLALEQAHGEGGGLAITDHQQIAINLLFQDMVKQAGGDKAKMKDAYILAMSNIMNRRETARTLRIGKDQFMTPQERREQQIADMIFAFDPKMEKRMKTMSYKERVAFLAKNGDERIAKVEAALKELGLTIAKVTGKNQNLALENSRLMKEMLKLHNAMEQDIIRAVQKGWSMADIKRRWGPLGAGQAMAIITKARQELFTKIDAMSKGGMTREDIREAMKDGLKAAGLGGTSGGMTAEEIWGMIDEDFGLPAVIPDRPLPSVKPKKAKVDADTNPLTSDWSRPDFADGLASYAFDTKDRVAIMERVEVIRGLAGALGKIDGLAGDKRAKAEAQLKEIDQILSKYGTDAKGIFDSAKGIESYGFDINDVAQVAAVARAISMIDADVVDKATEWLYFSMLSGLQTMLVNATAVVPAAWEATVGRGFESAINLFLKDPMSAQLGEAKYIVRAMGPALTRAMSNAQATFAAQHPMFDRDVLAKEVDWERVMGGKGYRTGGSIAGKWGDRIRIPMRILAATDDFNTTLMACSEAGAFAYRIAKAKGYADGSPEMDRLIRVELNTPNSFSYKLATLKAKSAIFSNPLPGQHDPVTGEKVPVNDLGDMAGYLAGKLTDTFAKEHDNLAVKAGFAAMRIAFFPFQRTPFNILRKGVRYTLNPFSLFDIGLGIARSGKNEDGKWEFKIKGGSDFDMQRRLQRADLVRRSAMQLQGASLMLLLAGLGAGEGDDDDQSKPFLVTGSAPFSPRGRAERDAAMRSGIGPYRISIRRKDGSERFGFNYGRIEPLATTLAASIDTMKSIKRTLRGGGDASEASASALGGFVAQAQDKSFLRGMGDLVSLVTNALAEPDLRDNRKFQQFLAGRIAMVMPNIIKQPIREADSQFRERSEGFMQELLYSLIPYGQKEARVDPFGKAVEKIGNPAGRIIDVTDAGTDKVNPVDSMLLRFRDRHPDKAWFPTAINNAEFTHRITGQNVKMGEAQLAEFRAMAGRLLDGALKAQNLNYQNPSQVDIDKVKAASERAREVAKASLRFKFARETAAK